MPGKRGISIALAVALCAAALGPAAASAGAARLGVDVSRFNGTIDWVAAKQAGVTFAFVQASRGTGLDCDVKPDSCGADPLYASNYAAARAAGIRVGPYHRAFIDPETPSQTRLDALTEANVFLASVGTLQRGDLRPVIDFETPFDGAPAAHLRIWLRTWLRRVGDALRTKPIIYTNASSWGMNGDVREFAKRGHRLWVAEWGVRKPTVPALNWAGRGWSVWQFTSSGRLPGFSGRVDLNRLRVSFKRIRFR
jgi:GH25 family lysozyme M1 (1,4-beta-N-acetylmuramidase)